MICGGILYTFGGMALLPGEIDATAAKESREAQHKSFGSETSSFFSQRHSRSFSNRYQHLK